MAARLRQWQPRVPRSAATSALQVFPAEMNPGLSQVLYVS